MYGILITYWNGTKEIRGRTSDRERCEELCAEFEQDEARECEELESMGTPKPLATTFAVVEMEPDVEDGEVSREIKHHWYGE